MSEGFSHIFSPLKVKTISKSFSLSFVFQLRKLVIDFTLNA